MIELFKQRINRCERECENMIEAKMDVQQKTLDEEQKHQMLEKEFDELKAHQKETKSGLELFIIQDKENKAQVRLLFVKLVILRMEDQSFESRNAGNDRK